MKELTFESQGTNTYLVYTISEDDCVDSMSLGMLTNNKIAGLAPVIFMQVDTTKYIKYNVSSHISVKQFFSGPVNKKRLTGVFNGIVDAMLSAEDYMLDTNSIIVDLDYIFADVSTCETVLICLPLENIDGGNVDLGAFFKNIMFSTQFDQTENCDYVAKIMNYLNSSPVFSLTDFKSVLNDLNTSERAPQVENKPQPIVAPREIPSNSETIYTPPQPVEKIDKEQPRVEVTPPRPTPPPTFEPTVASVEKDEKKMTLFGLLSHYNKENAALYKAQKAESKKQAKEKTGKEGKRSKKKDAKKGAEQPNLGFVIPGMEQPPISPKSSGAATPTETPKPVDRPNPVPHIQPLPQGHSANYGETTVLGDTGDGKTTVLVLTKDPQQAFPYLIRKKTNEKILLNKPVFRIGKERSYVDYFIGDNTAISRSHANIITRDGKYFVVDTNSTNHTFVNGEMIQCNVEMEIAHSTIIRLANEDFEFYLY